MPSLSLGIHIIARDEEELLPRCLQSVAELCDELIVVDTGSKDRTKQIAQSYGAKVISMEWNDDFAAARNLALEETKSDWVFFIDADEWLQSDIQSVRDCLRDPNAIGYWVTINNEIGPNKEDLVTHESLRLFRAHPAYRFSGRIHEEIIHSILANHSPDRIKKSAISIGHSGYRPERIKQKNKIKRNESILLKALSEKPGDPFYLYNLGVTYCQSRQLPKARAQFQKAYSSIPRRASYRPTFLRDFAKLLFALGEIETVQTLLKDERKTYPDYADLHVLFGKSLEIQGLLEEAFHSYQAAAQIEKNEGAYVTEAGMSTYYPLWRMAEIRKKQSRLDEAKQYYEKALSHRPGRFSILSGWIDLLDLRGVSDKRIAEKLNEYVDDATDAAKLLAQIGAYAEALDRLNNDCHPSVTRESLRIECYARLQRFNEAIRLFEIEPAAASSEIQAICYWSDRRSLPDRFYKQLSPAQQHLYQTLERYLKDHKSPAPSRPFVRQLIERAVRFGQLDLAKTLANETERAYLSKCLYRRGFVRQATELFLQLIKIEKLDAEGMIYLAEILYRKRQYNHAAEWFERALSTAPDRERASLGAALCYLRLGEQVLREGLDKFPNDPGLLRERERLRRIVHRLEHTDWMTVWTGAERRNEHV